MRSNGDIVMGEQTRTMDRGASAALSVVLMSTERSSPVPAVTTIHETCARFDAQLILVTQSVLDGRTARRMQDLGVDVVQASVRSSRAEMCDLGMARVRGNIVTVRDVSDVSRADFLQAFARVVPQVASDAPARRERVVVREREVHNSMVAQPRSRADQAPERVSGADLVLSGEAATEMAASM